MPADANQNGDIDCVWIPAGQWRQEKKILTDDPLNRGMHNQVGIRDVTIRGAGMWHSQLYSLIPPHLAPGVINHPHEGNFGFDIDDNTQISDIAIFGSGRIRGGDGYAEGGVGLNGRFGKNTRITNVWIEHANVGVWVGRDYTNLPDRWNPGDGLQFTGMRIRDTYADGINFTNGTRNSTVFNSSFRTTGDDALAVWASKYVKDQNADVGSGNAFLNNTIALPWRANGIAIYGGANNRAENNVISDTANYPGIMLATDHDPLPFGGTTTLANNALYRTGGAFWGEAQEFGAITLFSQNLPIPGVVIRDTEILDSTFDGIQFKGGGSGMPDVQITNVRIDRSNNVTALRPTSFDSYIAASASWMSVAARTPVPARAVVTPIDADTNISVPSSSTKLRASSARKTSPSAIAACASSPGARTRNSSPEKRETTPASGITRASRSPTSTSSRSP